MAKKLKNKGSRKIWAVVTAAVVIVILFVIIAGLWITNLLAPGCHAYSGFSCSITNYNNGTGSVTLLIGQNTGNTWYNIQAIYEPGNNGIKNVSLEGMANLSGVTLHSGDTTQATFNLGPNAMGSVWEIYTNSSGVVHYVRIGELILRH